MLKFLKILFKNHKYLVSMYLLGAYLIFGLIDFGYLDMYQWFEKNLRTYDVGMKLMYCINELFRFKINLTMIIIVLELITMNGFFYILDMERSLIQVMFRSGCSKKKIVNYVVVFNCALNLIPLIASLLLFTLYCITFQYHIRIDLGAFLFSIIILIINELVVITYYAKNSNNLL